MLVGSVAGYSGLPKAIGYGASKAALIHLAENLRIDLAQTGIKVQLVSPGFVKTRLTDKNSFDMPFIMQVDAAAERITEGIKSNRFEIHFPRRFSHCSENTAPNALRALFPCNATDPRIKGRRCFFSVFILIKDGLATRDYVYTAYAALLPDKTGNFI